MMTSGSPGGATPHQNELAAQFGAFATAIKAMADDDDAFFGTAIDAKANTVTVYSTRPPTTAQRGRYQAAAPGATVRYATAVLSRTQVTKLNALVSSKRAELLAQGLKVMMFGSYDGPTAPYVIMYTSGTPTPEMTSQFDIFGPGKVTFRLGDVRSLGR
jgi:hypothetical protein